MADSAYEAAVPGPPAYPTCRWCGCAISATGGKHRMGCPWVEVEPKPSASAHEAAVRAATDAGWYDYQAVGVLTCLAVPEVRAALVAVLNATDGWWDREAARTADAERLPMPGIRVWVLADAVLEALAGK